MEKYTTNRKWKLFRVEMEMLFCLYGFFSYSISNREIYLENGVFWMWMWIWKWLLLLRYREGDLGVGGEKLQQIMDDCVGEDENGII